MFWRHECCYYCWHRYRHLSFRRGMAALLILAVVVYGILHAPGLASHLHVTGPHHTARHHATHGHLRPVRARHHRPAGKAVTPARAAHSRRPPSSSRARQPGVGQALSWTNFHGLALPISAAAGPHYTRNGLAREFAHSQAGALLAAINIAVRTAAPWGPGIFRRTITQQVTGSNAPALLRADTNAYAQLHGTSSTGRGQPGTVTHTVEQAYRFLAYTPTSAIVDVVTAGQGASGTPVLVATRLHVVWLRGDWRLAAPPEGDWTNVARAISSLAGYTLLSVER
jgi:hypothetical protein